MKSRFLLTNEIRALFIDFFRRHHHQLVPSSPLIPKNDPSLMFTNAGMVQFKNVFTGLEKPNFNTAVSSQKCLRVGGKHNDLENVGLTNRHHTFFEMLGNFSFGEYFKENAIELAWNFVTKELCLDKNRLYLTVYDEDDESYSFWKKISGYADDRIIKIKTSDNFWSMGDTGPCGPCSEIFYDYGDALAGGPPGSENADGDRYVEIWNLVFMQFNRDVDGKLNCLPKKCIDTGMGLERIASVLQGQSDNYAIDLFSSLIKRSQNESGNTENKLAHRIIVDHLRAAAFLIAEGVMPGNDGRNYVLRRIIRRATRYIYQLGCRAPLLHRVFPELIDVGSQAKMSDVYPELLHSKNSIEEILKSEEVNFTDTLINGLNLIHKAIENHNAGDVLSGELAFKLYDTYGFPVDITIDIAKERGLLFDSKSFELLMQAQKDRARKNWVGSGEGGVSRVWFEALNQFGNTQFTGYEDTASLSSAILMIVNKDCAQNMAKSGEEVEILLDNTPFYAESGGQVGDVGVFENQQANILVLETKKLLNKLHVHKCRIISGSVKIGDLITAEVDKIKRDALRINHSATHLLHRALKIVLGDHVSQKGSLITPERIRFDFNYQNSLSNEQILQIEDIVNEMIHQNLIATTTIQNLEQAIDSGAMALFGEKYEDKVRVVTMGDSKELCGGTHVHSTGEIGIFKIVSESSIAFGVRRLEAVSGRFVIDLYRKKELLIKEISGILKVKDNDVIFRLQQMTDNLKKSELQIKQLYLKLAKTKEVNNEKIGEINFIYSEFAAIPADIIRDYALECSAQPNNVIAFLSLLEGKAFFILRISKEMINTLSAIEIFKKCSTIKAGGSVNLVQVGGPVETMRQVVTNIKNLLKQQFSVR